MSAHLYVNSKGYPVDHHSYSGSDAWHFCAKKYELERVQGWTEKAQRSSTVFGSAVEQAVTFYHKHRLDVARAVDEFDKLWAPHKDIPYSYTKTDLDWDRLSMSGRELVRLYHVRYPEFPYVVTDPENSFQVKKEFEVFPGSKLAGITFVAYLDMIAQIKNSFEPEVIDMKTSGKDIPEYTVLDPQLRSYSYVTGWPWQAFLWFRKCGRTISKGDTVTILEPTQGLGSGADVTVLACDDFGIWLTENPQVAEEFYNGDRKGESKAAKAARDEYVKSNGVMIPERMITKQKVQFKSVYITKESSDDIGLSVKRDIVQIVNATKDNFFPMQSGVRFPHDVCSSCAMRGICAGDDALRDKLLERKQLDEFQFQEDTE